MVLITKLRVPKLILAFMMLPIFSIFILFTGLAQAENPVSFNYADFTRINHNEVSLLGDAMFTSKTIQLTKPGDRNTSSIAAPDTAGQLIHNLGAMKSPIISFYTNFSATVSKAKNSNFSGEGFTFFFTPDPLNYQHPPIGRFGLPKRFLAFVFDTSPNINQDTSARISLCINNSADPLKTITFSDEYLDITNAHTFYAWIEYNSNNNYFGVFVNQDIMKPLNPVLFGTIGLSEFFTKYTMLYVGFSAYAVNHDEIYEVSSWSFTSFTKNPPKHNKIYIIVASCVAVFLLIVGMLVAFIRSSTGMQLQVGIINFIWKWTSCYQRNP